MIPSGKWAGPMLHPFFFEFFSKNAGKMEKTFLLINRETESQGGMIPSEKRVGPMLHPFFSSFFRKSPEKRKKRSC
jgi:hypothetical protein